MKKLALSLAIFITLPPLLHAAPESNSWYLGGKVGLSNFITPSGYPNASKNRLGAGVLTGYQFSPYLALEGGYDWLGQLKATSINRSITAQALQISGKLTLPFNHNRFDLMARVGMLVSHATDKIQDTSTRASLGSILAAGGIEYAFNKHWATRLEYQWAHRVADQIGSQMITIGINYRFGKPSPQPLPVVEAPCDPKPQAKEVPFALKQKVFFDFSSAELTSAANLELDNLYKKLEHLDPTEAKVVIVGHTDKLGNPRWNLEFSKKRAISVSDYLINKGIPRCIIEVAGEGSNQPSTNDTCSSHLAKKDLIECLAPDRRVEIDVIGIKTASH